MNRIVVITGASRGYGKKMADDYAVDNDTVIRLSRKAFDLNDQNAIRGFFDRMSSPRIDTLVLNAAIAPALCPIATNILSPIYNAFTINVISNLLILKCAKRLLNKSESPEVIFVSSELAKKATPYWGTYCMTKAALEMAAKVYQLENPWIKVRIETPK